MSTVEFGVENSIRTALMFTSSCPKIKYSMLSTSPKRVMAQEGPTKAEINAIFKRLKSISANKVYLKYRRI